MLILRYFIVSKCYAYTMGSLCDFNLKTFNQRTSFNHYTQRFKAFYLFKKTALSIVLN